MSEAVLAADSPTQEKPKAYHCPSCSAALYSPYHTVCPVCAEPIDTTKIEEALGKKVEVAGDESTGNTITPVKIGIAAVLGLALIAVAAVLLT